jgi:hypothetical protein
MPIGSDAVCIRVRAPFARNRTQRNHGGIR